MSSQKTKSLDLPKWAITLQASAMQTLLAPAVDPNFISFALGLPAVEFFPKDLYLETVKETIDSYPLAFQYAPPLPELKSHIVELMSLRGVTCSEDEIFLSSGAQQGNSLLTRLLLENGSTVMTEELTYPGMLQALKPLTTNILTVSTDPSTGIQVDEVEKILRKGHKPALLYMICDGNNPHSVNTAEYKRVKIAELANEFGLPVIEDDPYGFLSYENKLPCLKHYGGDWVFYVGSFSKIFAPSLRVGWVVAPKHLIPKLDFLKESSDINISTFTQRTVSCLLTKGIFKEHVNFLCSKYRKKRDCLAKALKKYFPQQAKFSIPESGIFFWVELPKHVNTTTLLKLSIENARVAFIPSEAFSATENVNITNAMRLNFSLPSEHKIEEGIKRLSIIVKQMLNRNNDEIKSTSTTL